MKRSLLSDEEFVGIFSNEQRGELSTVELYCKYCVSDAVRRHAGLIHLGASGFHQEVGDGQASGAFA